MVAHRFEIAGNLKLGETEFTLNGGFQDVMVPQMSQSFETFIQAEGRDCVATILQNTKYAAFGEEALYDILKNVCEDVKHCVLSEDNDLIEDRLQSDQVLLLAPTLKNSATVAHAISMTFYGDMCLISDKARSKNPGVEVYRIEANSNEIATKKRKVAVDIVRNMNNHSPDIPITTVEEFSTNMVKLLELKKTETIPLQAQYGENCTWSSCAKSVLFSALYIRLYSAAMKIPDIQQLPQDQAQSASHRMAMEYAKKIQHQWSDYDKYHCLQSYIFNKMNVIKKTYCKTPSF